MKTHNLTGFLLKGFIVFLSFGIILTSCNKDDDDDDNNNNNNNNYQTATTPTPEFTGADGLLVALKTISTTTVAGYTVNLELGTASATFFDTSSETFFDAGTISVDGNELSKQTGNSYVYIPAATDATGIEFSNDVSWEVSGNTTNDIPAISRSVNLGWPGLSAIRNVPTTVSVSEDYLLEHDGYISDADSVMFVLSANGEMVSHTTTGGIDYYHTFSSSDMSALSGSGFLQIAAYTYTYYTEGTKVVYYVNESVLTESVTFQ